MFKKLAQILKAGLVFTICTKSEMYSSSPFFIEMQLFPSMNDQPLLCHHSINAHRHNLRLHEIWKKYVDSSLNKNVSSRLKCEVGLVAY